MAKNIIIFIAMRRNAVVNVYVGRFQRNNSLSTNPISYERHAHECAKQLAVPNAISLDYN